MNISFRSWLWCGITLLAVGILALRLTVLSPKRVNAMPHELRMQIGEVVMGNSTQIDFDGTVPLGFFGQLENCHGLEILRLPNCPATDDDIRNLLDYPDLVSVALGETSVSNEGLRELCRLPRLKGVNLNGSLITDEGLAVLADVKQLKLLRLSQSKIEGHGLAALADHPDLRVLIIQHGPLKDEALAHVEKMPSLRTFYAEGTEITSEGLARLAERRPNLHIHPHP